MSKPVYVYNPGLHDVILMYSGREYFFPHKEVTTLHDQTFQAPDDAKRLRDNANAEDASAIMTMTVPAKRFAEILLGQRHHQSLLDRGWIYSELPILEDFKQKAWLKCRRWAVGMIDEFLNERRERMSGGMGRLSADPELVEWMIELDIEDPIYNPKKRPAIEPEILKTAVSAGVREVLETVTVSRKP